jgi:hypothetical protein
MAERLDTTEKNFKHGEAYRGMETSEYKSWRAMKNRCYQPSHRKFKNYGDKGIKVCERWHDYNNFIADMGKKPTVNHTIGRLDHSKDYELTNCEWQTRTKQARTSQHTKITLVIAREIRMMYNKGYSLRDLAGEFNLHHSTIQQITSGKTWKEGI